MQYPKLYLSSLRSEVRTGSGNASGTRMMLWMPLSKAVYMLLSNPKNWEQPRTGVSDVSVLWLAVFICIIS